MFKMNISENVNYLEKEKRSFTLKMKKNDAIHLTKFIYLLFVFGNFKKIILSNYLAEKWKLNPNV